MVLHQNDQGASYRRYGVLRWPCRPKINFCEIFDVVRFSTFETVSRAKRKLPCMHGRLGLRRRPVRNTSATYLAYVAEKADDTTDFDSEGREFESLRARQVPRQPGSRRNNFPDRTKNSGNNSIVIVTPNKEQVASWIS